MRPVVARVGAVTAAVLLAAVGVAAPVLACSYDTALAFDEIVATGPGGVLPARHGADQDPRRLLGVVEHAVTAHAPAIIPLTSERSTYLRVRSWGQDESDLDHLPVAQSGRSPYFGGIGDSCGPLRTPPRGATILTAVVDDGTQIRPHTIGPHEYDLHYADGITDDMRAELDAAFGPATVHEHGLGRRVWAAVGIWIVDLVVALVGLVLLAFAARVVWRHRREAA